jgi:DNA-binding NtrC family response regulator
VQRVLILGAGDEITQTEVETALGSTPPARPSRWRAWCRSTSPCAQAREQFEKAYLEYQLEKHAGNVSKMAKEAGMERTHLYRKLRSWASRSRSGVDEPGLRPVEWAPMHLGRVTVDGGRAAAS